MRIITGLLKGRKINIPKGLNVRPTTDRVKEGLFSVITSYRVIKGSRVLDLFAGSGSLGYEALSRGARSVRFVEHDRNNIKLIEKLANRFDMADQADTVNVDVKYFLEGAPIPADIIFCDPPYKYSATEEIVEAIFSNKWLQPNGWLILEHNKYYDFSEHSHFLEAKKYGRTYVSFFSEQIVNKEQ